MKGALPVLSLVSAAVLALSGCTGPSRAAGPLCEPVTLSVDEAVVPLTPTVDPQLPVTVRSADGRQVVVRDVSRILAVNLYGSLAEIVYGLGLGDRLVGRDRSTTFVGARELPLVTGDGHDLSAETVLGLNPTVVIADESIGPKAVLAQLRSAGIPIVMVDAEQTVAAVTRYVREIATALGVKAAGERLAARLNEEIRAASSAGTGSDKPVVAFLYLRGTAGVYLMGGDGAGSDEVIEAAGGIDAGTTAKLRQFRPITSEALAASAPDALLVLTESLMSVGGVDGLLKLPGVAQTPAAQARRVISVDDGLLLSFGTRTPRVISALAAALQAPCA